MTRDRLNQFQDTCFIFIWIVGILFWLNAGWALAEAYMHGKAKGHTPWRDSREKLPESIESSCVLWHIYDYDDGTNFYDYSTSQNDGTSSGSALPLHTNTVDGALLFDGTDDFVKIDASSSLNLTDNFSFFFWFKSFDLTTDALRIIHKNAAYQVANGAQTATTNDNYTLRLFNYATFADSYSSQVYTENEWNCATIVQNGSVVTFFRNAVNVTDVSSLSGTYTTNAVDLYLGIDEDETTLPFNGLLGEVYIFNVSLTTNNAVDLYNQTKSRYGL